MPLESALNLQTFLRELDKKFWTAAYRLGATNLDAAVYNKHAVCRPIFLKYVCDSFIMTAMIVVRDMWLTGFDVPCCHTMYVESVHLQR